jgi:hypothetical protein
MGFEYELTTKSKIFLLLYYFLKDFDMINYIYQLKIKLENEENMSWYYLCPRNIPVRVNWSPYHININYKISVIKQYKMYNGMFIKMVVDKHFFYHKYKILSLEEKIKEINKILSTTKNITQYVSYSINRLIRNYENFIETKLPRYCYEIK